MRVAFLIGALLLAASAGCGSQSDDESGGEPGTDSTPAETGPAGEPATELQITFWPQGEGDGGTAATATLTCDPPGGTVREPAEACNKLAALDDPFAPPSTEEMCTEQYGGPEQALIEGTYEGQPVRYPLSRTNGCEIARYEQYSFLLPGGGRA